MGSVQSRLPLLRLVRESCAQLGTQWPHHAQKCCVTRSQRRGLHENCESSSNVLPVFKCINRSDSISLRFHPTRYRFRIVYTKGPFRSKLSHLKGRETLQKPHASLMNPNLSSIIPTRSTRTTILQNWLSNITQFVIPVNQIKLKEIVTDYFIKRL